MKVYVSIAFQETSDAIELARAADELGYDGIGIPDHVVNLETLLTPYPYTADGSVNLAHLRRNARPGCSSRGGTIAGSPGRNDRGRCSIF